MSEDRPVVIVTGAAGNLGRALIARLARDGIRVAALERHGSNLDQLIQRDDLVLSGVDLADRDACASAVATVIKRYGRADGLAHLAGGFAAAPSDQAPDLFTSMFQINLLTAVNVFSAALPQMRLQRKGSLVGVGAGPALRASAALAAYAASKSGLLRLIESLAEEGREHGVRANAVIPSTIDTPQNRAAMPHADFSTWVRPDEVAAAIAFLLSEDSSGVTGGSLAVPGRV